jgi:aerobic-type carbon monoxide dehydrogenase small subunit (CoxS/CutS family)/carbon monoxide dehydrogenase subunit G
VTASDHRAAARRPAPRPGRIGPADVVDVELTVNGSPATLRVPTRMHLADALRDQLGLTGTHLGCEHGVCGMCTVLVDGAAARACLLFAVQCDGAEIVTVEGLGGPDDPHPLQRAFSAHHGLQCGFCTPGMLMSSYDLLANDPAVPADALPVEMSGVICRCTGYRGILAAVADVAASQPGGIPGPQACGPRTLVGRGAAAVARAHEPQPAAPVPQQVRLPSGPPSAVVEVTSTLSAPATDIWRVLDDFAQLARCLPGAELVEVLDETHYLGRAGVALGPVKLSFDGIAHVVERDPDAHQLRVHAQGVDTGGSATQADIRLSVDPAPGGAVLRAAADLYLSGRIAQFGRALAGDVSRRLFEQFAAAVEETALTGSAPAVGAAGPNPLRLAAAALRDAALAALRRAAARIRLRRRS